MNEFLNVRTDRLLELADHLEHGKLGHDRFNFEFINILDTGCGSAGCAIGELPYVWPEAWAYSSPASYAPDLITAPWQTERLSVSQWFGILQDHYYHLFFPDKQWPQWYGGTQLTPKATRFQVAANFRAFVKHAVEKGARSPKSWEDQP